MPEKIKIMYIIDHLKRDGGAQKALYMLVSALDKEKYLPYVVCLGINESYARDYQALGVRTKIYNTNALNGLCVLFSLFFLLRKEKPHIVQTSLFHADIMGRSLARLAHVPVIISSIRCTNVFYTGWQLALDKLTAGFAAKVTFVTKESVDFAIKNEGVKPEQVVVIPNGINVTAYEKTTDSHSLRTELGIEDDSFVIGAIGRLNVQKGFSYLIKATPAVLKKEPKTVFVILGKGPLEQELKESVKSLGLKANIKFLSPPGDIPRFMGMLDLYVLPSLYEGLSNSLLEAMAAGKPIVATRVDGNLEALDDKSGILIPLKDEKSLAEAILKLIEDQQLRQNLAKAAKERVKEKFSLDKTVAAYQMLYDELYAQKSSPDL